MNIPYSRYKARAERLTLAPGAAISVEARVGTELRSLEGRVWITQEGDVRDYIVPVGMRYTAGRSGRVVVNAVDGAAQVAVTWKVPEAAGALAQSRVSLDYESIAELKRAARRARSREIARLFRCGWAWLAHAFRHALGGEPSRVAAARPQAGCGC
jgi:hypothetical protein